MVANKNKLMGKIVENGYTQQRFVEAMGMTTPTFKAKMETSKDFTIGESIRAKNLLHLTTEEYLEIFINF